MVEKEYVPVENGFSKDMTSREFAEMFCTYPNHLNEACLNGGVVGIGDKKYTVDRVSNDDDGAIVYWVEEAEMKYRQVEGSRSFTGTMSEMARALCTDVPTIRKCMKRGWLVAREYKVFEIGEKNGNKKKI